MDEPRPWHARCICPNCRYALRGTAALRCPECGRALHNLRLCLGVWDPQRIIRAWHLPVWSILILLGVLAILIARNRPIPGDLLCPGIAIGIGAIQIFMWLRQRHREQVGETDALLVATTEALAIQGPRRRRFRWKRIKRLKFRRRRSGLEINIRPRLWFGLIGDHPARVLLRSGDGSDQDIPETLQRIFDEQQGC